jgi:hypothetical protein
MSAVIHLNELAGQINREHAEAPQPDSLLATLPLHIRRRLAAEDVRTLGDWVQLGPRRLQLFGITAKMVRTIDAAAIAHQAQCGTA